MASDSSITNNIRDVILSADIDGQGLEPVTLQEVLESGILAEVMDPNAVMQRLFDRLAAGIAARLEGVVPPANGAAATVPVEPFRNEKAAIVFLRDRLVACLSPRQIWLFGSRGDAKVDSDFDLLVALPGGLLERAT